MTIDPDVHSGFKFFRFSVRVFSCLYGLGDPRTLQPSVGNGIRTPRLLLDSRHWPRRDSDMCHHDAEPVPRVRVVTAGRIVVGAKYLRFGVRMDKTVLMRVHHR